MSAGAVLRCTRIVVREPKRAGWLVALGLVLLLVGTPTAAMACGGLGLLAPAALAVYTFIKAARRGSTTAVRGAVRLDDDALRLLRDREDGREPDVFLGLKLEAIESGYETMDERTVVLRAARGEEIVLQLENDEPARVLAHARVDVAQRTLDLPLRRSLGAFTIGFIAFWPILIGAMIMIAPALERGLAWLVSFGAALCLSVLVARRLGSPHVVVGADGIRFFGTLLERYFRYDEIDRVDTVGGTYGRNIVLSLRDGRSVTLPMVAAPNERLEGLVQRIRKAAQAHGMGDGRRLDGLSRAGRSLAEWRAGVERLALAPPGFRDNALGQEDFERVLADGGAPADQRIGAAVALRLVDAQGAAPRIRIAADATVDEALREALAAAAEGEVEEALVRVTAKRTS